MCLLDYAFYVYWKQLKILPLGLALKLGLHPEAIAHLSPGITSEPRPRAVESLRAS
jgi:hypothetical protein